MSVMKITFVYYFYRHSSDASANDAAGTREWMGRREKKARRAGARNGQKRGSREPLGKDMNRLGKPDRDDPSGRQEGLRHGRHAGRGICTRGGLRTGRGRSVESYGPGSGRPHRACYHAASFSRSAGCRSRGIPFCPHARRGPRDRRQSGSPPPAPGRGPAGHAGNRWPRCP